MTGSEYQEKAMRTCNIGHNNKEEMLYHAMLGLCSEAGEFAGIYQKRYQGHAVELEHCKKELGDCLWMIAEACQALGTDMDEIMEINIEKLKKRYPDGFRAFNSIHRKEGDV